jgi:WD40 repeat protein
MYKKCQIGLSTSSLNSMRLSNLSTMQVNGENLVCYVSLSDVVVAYLDRKFQTNSSISAAEANNPRVFTHEQDDMLKCKYVLSGPNGGGKETRSQGGSLFVFGSSGVSMYSTEGADRKWSCPMEVLAGSDDGVGCINPPDQGFYVSCVASLPQNIIAVGLSNGFVCLLYRDSGELVRRLQSCHRGSPASCVVELECTNTHLVSVNENNEITAFATYSDYATVHRMTPPPCSGEDLSTAMCILHEHAVVVGYASGHIRVYSLKFGGLVFEIAAHGRCVTALSAHPTNGVFCSCSEDQCLSVYSLPSAATESQDNLSYANAELVYHETVEDTVFTGVAWMEDGEGFLASSYDTDCLEVVVPKPVRKM